MRVGFAVIFGLLTAVVSAQSGSLNESPKCRLPLTEAPRTLGLQLGMTHDEVRRVLGREVKTQSIRSTIRYTTSVPGGNPETKLRETEAFLGESEYSHYPHPDTNIGSTYIRFWSGKLYTILLTFDDRDFDWRPGEEMYQAVARRMGLPGEGWKTETLECHGFYITFVQHAGSIQIEITDLDVKNEIKAKAERSIHESELLIVSRPRLRKPYQKKGTTSVKPVLRVREKLCRKTGVVDPVPWA